MVCIGRSNCFRVLSLDKDDGKKFIKGEVPKKLTITIILRQHQRQPQNGETKSRFTGATRSGKVLTGLDCITVMILQKNRIDSIYY